MDSLTKALQSYSGRDKVLRTLCYSSLYLSGVTKGRISEKFQTFSSQMSACRTILRLFDDLPMLHYTLSYGLGRKEKDEVLKCLNILNNVIDQLYYPVEHIAWAAEHKILNINSSSWWYNATYLWAISLYIGIIRSARYIMVLQHKKQTVMSCVNTSGLVQHQKLTSYQRLELLSILQNALDLMNAVNWFPKGYLWAETLKPWQSGLFGLLSTFISILRLNLQSKLND